MRRRINLAILAMILLVGLPYYWLMLDNRPGTAAAKPIAMEQLRRLAGERPGPVPATVEVELVAFRHLPRNLFAAGHGMKRALIGVMAWRLQVPGGKPILIDTGLDPVDAQAMGMDKYWPERQAKVTQAMAASGMILATHEHPDHLGALARIGGVQLSDQALLSAGQLPPSRYAKDLRWNGPPPKPRLAAAVPQSVAPGVVIIPAPSHTPGSQMIFVRLSDGREVLFTGDIATLAASWQELRARSRLVGDHLAPEDRAEVYAWLRTIRALKAEAPGLIVIPGHDYESIVADEESRNLVHPGFRQ